MDGGKIQSRIYETPVTYGDVRCLCYDAIRYGFESVQVFPCMVGMCKKVLDDSKVKIDALINYPHGGWLTEQKIDEALEAVELGAEIIEVTGNIRAVKRHDFEYVFNEMNTIRKALPKDIELRYIIEIEYLTDEELEQTIECAVKAGVDCISTSTGLYHSLDKNRNDVEIVASPEDVKRIKEISAGKLKVQSVGFVNSSDVALRLLEAGADIVSSEKAVSLVD